MSNSGTPNSLAKLMAVTRPEEYGAKRDGVTDDTVAIREAIWAAVGKGIAAGTNYAEVWFTAGTYLANGEPDTTQKGNAIIALPLFSETGPGFTLVFRGVTDASPISYFRSESHERRGVRIKSTRAGAFIGGLGATSLIGGPTPQALPEAFSNLLFVLDGIMIEQPKNPSLVGLDLRKVSEVNIVNGAALVSATPKELSEHPIPENELGIGLYMPAAQNGNNANIGTWTAEGYYYGIGFNDHMRADRILSVWCNKGMFIGEAGLHSRGATIHYASVVACQNGVVCEGGVGTRFPLVISHYQTEEIAALGKDFVDPNNALRGHVYFNESQKGEAPKLTGAEKLVITNMNT